MRMWAQSHFCQKPHRGAILAASFTIIFLILSASQPANALPAFARKYGLRCSACHESWPMLNYFGQKFKDNGYQLMNDRDAPIWQTPFLARIGDSCNVAVLDAEMSVGNELARAGKTYRGHEVPAAARRT